MRPVVWDAIGPGRVRVWEKVAMLAWAHGPECSGMIMSSETMIPWIHNVRHHHTTFMAGGLSAWGAIFTSSDLMTCRRWHHKARTCMIQSERTKALLQFWALSGAQYLCLSVYQWKKVLKVHQSGLNPQALLSALFLFSSSSLRTLLNSLWSLYLCRKTEPKILRLVIFISPRPLHHSPDLRLNYHNLACFPLSHLSQFSDSQRQRSHTLARKLESKFFLSQASVIHQKKRIEKWNQKIVDFKSVSGPSLELFHFLWFLIVK